MFRSASHTLRFDSSIINFHCEPGDSVFGKFHFASLVSDPDTNPPCCTTSFRNGVADKTNIFGLTRHFNADAVVITTVFDCIILNDVAIGPEVQTTILIAEQNAERTTVPNLIVSHHVVGIVVTNGNTVEFVAVDDVVFCQTIFDAPAPEDALTVAFQSIAANDRSLRARTGMHAKIRVVVL